MFYFSLSYIYVMTHVLPNLKCNHGRHALLYPYGQMETQLAASSPQIIKSCDVHLTPLSPKENTGCPLNWSIWAVVWLMSESRFDPGYVVQVYGG